MLQLIKYYLTGAAVLPAVLILTLLSLAFSLYVRPEEACSNYGFIIILTSPYMFMFYGNKKKKVEYGFKYSIPISKLKTNIAKFISFYICMAVAAAIVFYIDIWNGHEPMPILINILKQLGMNYIMITLISRLFSLKNWERLMNIPTLIYLIIMVACFFIIAQERPDVLQMQGIPSHGIYGVMLYFSILLIAISADFYAYHASSKKLVLA